MAAVFFNFELTEMIGQDRISNGDMTRNTFIEASVGEHPERGSEMLFPVESLFLQRLELWVRADSQFLAGSGGPQGTNGDVGGRRGIINVESRSHVVVTVRRRVLCTMGTFFLK